MVFCYSSLNRGRQEQFFINRLTKHSSLPGTKGFPEQIRMSWFILIGTEKMWILWEYFSVWLKIILFLKFKNIHLFGCVGSLLSREICLASCAIFHWGVWTLWWLQGQQLQSMGSRARVALVAHSALVAQAACGVLVLWQGSNSSLLPCKEDLTTGPH